MAADRNPRKVRYGKRVSVWRSGKYWTLLVGLFVLTSLTVIIVVERPGMLPALLNMEKGAGVDNGVNGYGGLNTGQTAEADKAAAASGTADPAQTASPSEKQKQITDFHMQDLLQGWIRYTDTAMITQDGGAHWTEIAATAAEVTQADEQGNPGIQALMDPFPRPLSISYKSKPYQVIKSQFLTDHAGWVVAADAAGVQSPLLITLDGGATWQDQVTPEITTALDEEQKRIKALQLEASYYPATEAAKKAIHSEWTLFPAVVSPGDVILVRHKEAGEVRWQGKTYPLQSFGLGYFTYLPLSMDVKPGQYPIGNQLLTIKAKKFETQYLQVTKEMESMKQDTKRINADQKKIDAARSHSQQEFLFSSDFIQPIEGILTTPYGYTRYVNGKFDSSHRAIDLAAKEGTPIKATNDGVVALADSLYLTGNSIYIDHGMGLFSQYAHMSELRVKTGDQVKKGDIIGLVGTTGFSTGPHLHFTFWAHNVPVNPNLFFGTTPFQWTDKPAAP